METNEICRVHGAGMIDDELDRDLDGYRVGRIGISGGGLLYDCGFSGQTATG